MTSGERAIIAAVFAAHWQGQVEAQRKYGGHQDDTLMAQRALVAAERAFIAIRDAKLDIESFLELGGNPPKRAA